MSAERTADAGRKEDFRANIEKKVKHGETAEF